jgi:2-(1,2-epoxy-1,2-dihydrophenyl)acetyl-CoA isomerase
MSYQNIVFTVEAGIARLTLHRPDKLNSFTWAMHEELRNALARVTSESGVRVLLLTGAGRGFCAGQDLSEQADDLGETVARDYAPLVRTLRALSLPVVCAVNGIAAGAGTNVAFACDIVLAKKSASFIQPFCKLGLVPDTGGTYFLPRLAGTARAMGMAMLGDKISAEQAAAWGLIWKCVEDESFESEIEALLAKLAAAPTLGLARTKQAIYASSSSTMDEQLECERAAMSELGYSEDYREGVAAFLAKRSPVFHGR